MVEGLMKKENKKEKKTMMKLEDIRNNEIVNVIDWDMTPEEAVTLYLEWGNNWSHGKNVIRSKSDVSYYFVVNTWEDPPKIYLIRRNSEEAVELAAIDMPEALRDNFLESVGHNKGVYPINDEIRDMLESALYGDALH
jgi:hypothetical protein